MKSDTGMKGHGNFIGETHLQIGQGLVEILKNDKQTKQYAECQITCKGRRQIL